MMKRIILAILLIGIVLAILTHLFFIREIPKEKGKLYFIGNFTNIKIGNSILYQPLDMTKGEFNDNFIHDNVISKDNRTSSYIICNDPDGVCEHILINGCVFEGGSNITLLGDYIVITNSVFNSGKWIMENGTIFDENEIRRLA